MLGKIITITTIVAAIGLIIMMQTTNPSTVGPLGLLAVFFLIYMLFIGIITELLWGGSYVLGIIKKKLGVRKATRQLNLTRAYYFSSILALGPVMALALQSIGSLGIYESVLILVFLAIGILYISKRSLN